MVALFSYFFSGFAKGISRIPLPHNIFTFGRNWEIINLKFNISDRPLKHSLALQSIYIGIMIPIIP